MVHKPYPACSVLNKLCTMSTLSLGDLLRHLVCSISSPSFSVFRLVLLQISTHYWLRNIVCLRKFFMFYREKNTFYLKKKKKVWMAESSERKYPNVKYAWKNTLGRSNCSVFSDHVNFLAILPGCSVAGLNQRKSLPCCFFSSSFLSSLLLLILSQQTISAIFGGSKVR